MNTIKGTELAEQWIGKWSPRDLAIIERVELSSDPELSCSSLILVALFQRRTNSWPNFEEKMFRVTICFDAVGSLRLKDFGGGPVQIMGFDIHFVGDRRMEGVNYEVEDYEDDRIHFVCRGVSVLSVTPSKG
jgi:hypothetical protein